MLELDRIYHADTFELVAKIDDESVDLVVCDGPYGVPDKPGTRSAACRPSTWN